MHEATGMGCGGDGSQDPGRFCQVVNRFGHPRVPFCTRAMGGFGLWAALVISLSSY